MKKTVVIIAVLVMLLCLTGCGGTGTGAPENGVNTITGETGSYTGKGTVGTEKKPFVNISAYVIGSERGYLNIKYFPSDMSYRVELSWHPAEPQTIAFDGRFQSGYIKGKESIEFYLNTSINGQEPNTFVSYGMWKNFSAKADVQALFPSGDPIECYLVGKSGMQDVTFTIPAEEAEKIRSWIDAPPEYSE